jgi:hypothetical protein
VSPLQRHRHNMRREARRKLQDMVEQQAGKCHYCGERIVCLSWLGDRLLGKDSRTCRFFENGEVVQVRIASVEHLTRLADGGGNDDGNLAASCVRCNSQRSNPPRQPRKCRGCGQPSGRRRRCERCMSRNQNAKNRLQ